MAFKFSSLAKIFALTCLSTTILTAAEVQACTRFVYTSKDNQVLTGRSMDWQGDIRTDLWVFPQGMKRDGAAGAKSIHWVSKYGSVTASAFNLTTSYGMNEAGLVANILWLPEAGYPKQQDKKPTLSVSAWVQFVLDHYATVNEAVTALQKEPFTLVSGNLPTSKAPVGVHLSISDASGDSAIIEYVDGKQKIYHSRAYQVMTNSPTYDEQIALNNYWKQIGGTVMLPGTSRPADRFARASFYTNATTKTENPQETLSTVFSIIRNTSVPLGISTPDSPHIAGTRWRTVSDQKNKIYYFESAFGQSAFSVEISKLDLSAKTGKVMKLSLGKDQSAPYNGVVNNQFKVSEPFKFYDFSKPVPLKPVTSEK